MRNWLDVLDELYQGSSAPSGALVYGIAHHLKSLQKHKASLTPGSGFTTLG